jgi:hypothetical protein
MHSAIRNHNECAGEYGKADDVSWEGEVVEAKSAQD